MKRCQETWTGAWSGERYRCAKAEGHRDEHADQDGYSPNGPKVSRCCNAAHARGVAEGLERAAMMLESMRDDSGAVAMSSDDMGRRDIADFARAECSAFGQAVTRIRALGAK